MSQENSIQQVEQAGASSNGLANDPELIADFLAEMEEHIASIENNLLLLDRDSTNAEAPQAIFRSYHTIKGLAGFLEFPDLQQVAHEVESLLDRVRSHTIEIDSSIIDLILESVDFLKGWVARIKGTGSASESLAATLECIVQRVRAATSESNSPRSSAAGQERRADPSNAGGPQPEKVEGTLTVQPAGEPPPVESSHSDGAVRIPTAKLDYLVDMVGEMVIAQSLLRNDPTIAKGGSRLARNLSQLNRITSEIQKTAMSMRMIPVGRLFRRMARLLRDQARKSDKQVELETVGEETELDRTIIEELGDPLMHMIRNAVDHGIEPVDRRVAAGKPRVAHIGLKAYHRGGYIIIELSDDGGGIDRQLVLSKALERGLAAEGAELSDADILQFIFHPGFSTAARVTAVSGRGVGMDVVRKHIEKLRGRILIESKPGIGTTFILKLPLTLAIIEGLVVGVGTERYVVPIFAVREVLRPNAGMISTVQGKGEMALVRDSMLPIVRLYRRFQVTPDSESATDSILIVSENAGKRFCLMVDRLMGKQEVVIKNLGEALKNIAGVAGGAILGDGHVGLILDMDGLCNDGA